ncbi:hypothetical protein [Tumebacillus flagellatus]|uniref:hypothetical protein n=1 Tax=Tumebacillus flagellatus TaxID=1157490 RepID=UPI00126849CC|nr:hypothetical protein [Tumebacillus flagellatus]
MNHNKIRRCYFEKILSPLVIMFISTSILPVASFADQPVQVSTTAGASVTQGVEIHEPPQGWNPLTATDAELNFYNYPPRPRNQEAMAQWTEVVSKSKWVGGEIKKGIPRSPQVKTASEPSLASYTFSSNWDGVVSKKTYDEVYGYWKQPIAATDSTH